MKDEVINIFTLSLAPENFLSSSSWLKRSLQRRAKSRAR